MVNVLIKSSGCTENNYFCAQLKEELNNFSLDCDLKMSNAGCIDFDKSKRYDILIFGSCTNLGFADDRMIDYFKSVKKYNPGCSVILWGCSVNNRESLKKLAFEGIEMVVVKSKIEILNYLKKRCSLKKTIRRDDPESFHSQQILVKSGCKRFCSYCIAPFVRKPFKVVSSIEIINEIKAAEKRGVKVVSLCGSCIGDWKDPETAIDFPGLLQLILNKTDVEINDIYLNPLDVNQRLLSLFPNPRIHMRWYLPIQSSSAKVLKKMKRRYTPDFLSKIFKEIRFRMPDVHLATAIIIGFPSETQGDFRKTLDFIGKIGFNVVNGFVYDPRPMTAAAKMPQISEKIKISRVNEFKRFCLDNQIKYTIVGQAAIEE